MKPSGRASVFAAAVLLALLLLAPGAALASTPSDQAGLKVDWQRAQTSGLGAPEAFTASAYGKGTYVVSDVAYDQGARIWASSDALNWQLVWRGEWAPDDIVPGGPGFVAWSQGILLSKNGRHWTHVTQGIPQPLLDADVTSLAGVAGVVVAFPDSGRGYWSADGRTWEAIGTGPQKLMALAGDGTHLWALTGGWNWRTSTGRPIDVWVTTDGRTWTKSGQLPGSHRVTSVTAAFGPLGGVVVSGMKAWFSADDIHWRLATNTPSVTTKGRDSVDAIVGDASGFILTAHRDPPGCVLDPYQRRALTWTSIDGKIWREMPEQGWLGREIDQLLVTDRTLWGIGIDWRHDLPSGTVWHAQLPAVASDNAPPPTPVPDPGPGGCGP